MKILSFNGIDCSGKSQQIKLLNLENNNNFHFTKSLSKYGDQWPALSGYPFAKWWFEDVPAIELTNIIINSLNLRHQDCVEDKINILDRGVTMFKAVCTASYMLKEKIDLNDAISIVKNQFAERLTYLPDEEQIYLQKDDDYWESMDKYIQFIRPTNNGEFPQSSQDIYNLYQKILKEVISVMFSESSSSSIKNIVVNKPIIDIQNEIRETINSLYSCNVPKIGEGIKTILGFTGYSECGKSSFADSLRVHKGFGRLKLRYFNEVLSSKKLDHTPENVISEFILFSNCHYYISSYSIESIHGPKLAAIFKLMFGNRYNTIFIQTNKELRIQRSSKEHNISLDEASRLINEKDRIKDKTGMFKLSSILDGIVDNSQNCTGSRKILSKIEKWL